MRECSFGFLCDFVVAGLRGGLAGLLSGCLLVWRWYFDLVGVDVVFVVLGWWCLCWRFCVWVLHSGLYSWFCVCRVFVVWLLVVFMLLIVLVFKFLFVLCCVWVGCWCFRLKLTIWWFRVAVGFLFGFGIPFWV